MSIGNLSRADNIHQMMGSRGGVEELEEEGWAAVRHAVGPCSAYCMSALGLVHDGQLHREGKGISVCSGLYHIEPIVFSKL